MVPCYAVGPADAPVIQDEVDPVISNAVAPMCGGNSYDAAPKVPCEDASKIPAPVMIPVPVIPADADPSSGWHLSMSLGILITRCSSSEIRSGSLLV